MSENEVKEYDEDDAIKFIANNIPQELKKKYSGDDYLTIIDVIFDYYEDKGLFDIDIEEEDEPEWSVTDLVSYVKNQLRKDSDNTVEIDDVKAIVEAELEYEKSLGLL